MHAFVCPLKLLSVTEFPSLYVREVITVKKLADSFTRLSISCAMAYLHVMCICTCTATGFSKCVVQVVLTFSMQGLGNFTNTAVLCILLVIYNQTQPSKTLPHHYTGWR